MIREPGGSQQRLRAFRGVGEAGPMQRRAQMLAAFGEGTTTRPILGGVDLISTMGDAAMANSREPAALAAKLENVNASAFARLAARPPTMYKRKGLAAKVPAPAFIAQASAAPGSSSGRHRPS